MRQAYGHKARSGKDTAVNYNIEKYGGKIIRFADPVYKIATYIQTKLGKKIEKNPKLLQFIGEGLKAVYHDENLWVEIAEKKIKKIPSNTNIYIPDLRFKSEYEMLKKHDFTCIKINRKNRLIDRDENHKSEIDLNEVKFDKEIDNNSTLKYFYQKLNKL